MTIKNVIIKNYVCCFDVTLATRLIGLIGVAICAILFSVLLNDKISNDYNVSRKTALALGLDWQHFHSSANATHDADPAGRMISIIMIFYASVYLITSLSLIYATIYCIRWYTLPWLFTEAFGCISKIVALIFHAMTTEDQYNGIFIIGSILYLIIMSWWWLTVFAAQHSWKTDKNTTYIVPLTTIGHLSNISAVCGPAHKLQKHNSVMGSPIPYEPNENYTVI